MNKIATTIAICVFTLFANTNAVAQESKTYTVIIDAGHGGKDNGAKNQSINEKDVTLAISKKIEELNNDENIKLVFTRVGDDFITLDERVKSTTNTDLLISLHIGTGAKNVSGMEIYYPRDSEFSQTSRKFGYILSKSFTDYDIQINSLKMEPANFFVLKSANCPAVLVELGYLSNEEDVAYLSDETNQEEMALAILQSIESMIPEE